MVRVDLKEENESKFIQLTNRVLFSAACNRKIMIDCKRSKTGEGRLARPARFTFA